jgi:hypothetical protein
VPEINNAEDKYQQNRQNDGEFHGDAAAFRTQAPFRIRPKSVPHHFPRSTQQIAPFASGFPVHGRGIAELLSKEVKPVFN